MFKRVWNLLTFVVALLVLGTAMLNVFAFYAPNSAASWLRFRWIYDHTGDRNAVLDEYHDQIWQHGGGSIPPDIARFLCGRIESSSDEEEVAAITRFYSLEAGGREPLALFDLTDRARRRVAQVVLRDWKSYPGEGAQHGFVLIEGLRQNSILGKASIILPSNGWADSPEKLTPVALLFQKWNSKYRSVPFTKRPNPLAGTPYRIEAP